MNTPNMPGGSVPPPPAPPPPPGYHPPPPSNPRPYGWNPYGWQPVVPQTNVGWGRFRPLGVVETVDAAFSLYRKNLKLFIGVAAVLQVPFAIISAAAYYVLGRAFNLQSVAFGNLVNQSNDQIIAQLPGIVGFLALVSVVTMSDILIVTPLTGAAMAWAVSNRYLDRGTSVGNCFSVAMSRLGSLLLFILAEIGAFLGMLLLLVVVTVVLIAATSAANSLALGLIAGLVIGVGFVALLIGWFYLGVRWSLTVPAIVLEQLSGIAAMKRSWRLVNGGMWRIVGTLFLVGLVAAIANAIVVEPVGLVGGLTNNLATQQMLEQLAQTFAAVFVVPLSLTASTLLYYNQRIRKEAFDLEMLAASL